VQLVIAAMSTAPSFSSKLWPSSVTCAVPLALGFFVARSVEVFAPLADKGDLFPIRRPGGQDVVMLAAR